MHDCNVTNAQPQRNDYNGLHAEKILGYKTAYISQDLILKNTLKRFCFLCRKLLVEKRYIISNLSATTSEMTLNSTLPQAESAFQLYDDVGAPRRPSQLAEIGEETMMWLNRENESPYVFDRGENETLSEPEKNVRTY